MAPLCLSEPARELYRRHLFELSPDQVQLTLGRERRYELSVTGAPARPLCTNYGIVCMYLGNFSGSWCAH